MVKYPDHLAIFYYTENHVQRIENYTRCTLTKCFEFFFIVFLGRFSDPKNQWGLLTSTHILRLFQHWSILCTWTFCNFSRCAISVSPEGTRESKRPRPKDNRGQSMLLLLLHFADHEQASLKTCCVKTRLGGLSKTFCRKKKKSEGFW